MSKLNHDKQSFENLTCIKKTIDGKNVEIKKTSKDDTKDIINLALNTNELLTVTDNPCWYDENTFNHLIEDKNFRCYTMKVDSNFAGFFIYYYFSSIKEVFLACMAIHEEFRNKSYSNLFFENCRKELNHDFNWIWTIVDTTNSPSQKMIEKQGYKRDNRKYYYYYKKDDA